jgi:hypothetical protein
MSSTPNPSRETVPLMTDKRESPSESKLKSWFWSPWTHLAFFSSSKYSLCSACWGLTEWTSSARQSQPDFEANGGPWAFVSLSLNLCYSIWGYFGAWEKMLNLIKPVLRIRIRRISMFLGLPDPLVRGMYLDPYPSSIKQKLLETLNPSVLWLPYDFLSLKND